MRAPGGPVAEGAVPANVTVEDLYETIRGRILGGELEAGVPISQVRLARELGVNRTPLREALRMVQREGLVEGEYNRRVRVAALTCVDLEQLYALRIPLEALAVRLTVPTLDTAEHELAARLLAEMERYSRAEEFGDWERSHRAFHRLFLRGAGNRVRDSVVELMDYCERYRRALIQRTPAMSYSIGAAEHTAIAAAAETGDPLLAAERIGLHLARTALSLVALTDPTYDPAAVREALRLVAGDAPLPTPFNAPGAAEK